MSLSCHCDGGDMDWWHYGCEDYTRLDTKRARRCCSCKALIKRGDLCAKFERARVPQSMIEERIYGTESVPLPPKFMCETCADIYFSLDELGFCINLGDSMRALAKEYAEVYGRRAA